MTSNSFSAAPIVAEPEASSCGGDWKVTSFEHRAEAETA